MKFLMASLILFPFSAFAGNTLNPMPNLRDCVFSRNVQEHLVIEYKDKTVCERKLCNHAVKCKPYTTYVTCPAKNGKCEGYTADECVAASTQVDAEYDTAPR
jgi:hypothetical protein